MAGRGTAVPQNLALAMSASPTPSTSPTAPPVVGQMPSWRVLVAIMVPVWLSALDTAIANTALPAIGVALGSSPAATVWVVSAFQLAVVASLFPLAALGDRLAPRRVFLAGVLVFALASLASALARDLWWLAAARALQGAGAAGIMATNLALVRAVYPAHRLGRGVGLNALVVGLGYTSGSTVASLILSWADWPWLFAMNLPVCAAAGWLGWHTLPRALPRVEHGLDLPLMLWTATTFGSGLGLVVAWTQGAAASVLWALVAVLVCSAWSMSSRQRGHPAPMFPVDLLRYPPFALSVLTSVSSFMAQGLAFVALPFYFESVLGRNAIETGFLLSSWALAVALMGPVAGRLSDRVRPGAMGAVGLVLLSVGLWALARLGAQHNVIDIVWRMGLCGVGFGLFQSPNLKAIMSTSPAHRSGGASGMVAMARLTGQTLGAAAVALFLGWYGTQGAHHALWLAAGAAIFAALVSVSRLRFDSHMTEVNS